MGAIEALLTEHCPGGVEHRTLGEVGFFIRGNGMQKKDLLSEGVPAIHYGQLFTRYATSAAETVSFVTPAFAAKLRQAMPGDLVIASTSENDDDLGKAVAWLGDVPAAVSSDACIYRHALDARYVAYVFQTAALHAQKRRFATGTKVRRVHISDLAKIRIPVPPLPVQRAIADALSAMEALQESLRDEEACRREQMETYRLSLLRCIATNDRALGDVLTIKFGQRITKKEHSGTRYPVYGGGGESFRTDDANRSDDVVVSRFAMSERCVRRVSGEFWLLDSGFTFDVDPLENDKGFVAHCLAAMQPAIYACGSQGAQRNIRMDAFKALTIPTPEVHVQRSIAERLDAMQSLIDNLAAERAARCEQFEHYRDRLLSFPESAPKA